MKLTKAGFGRWLKTRQRLHCGKCPLEHYLGVRVSSRTYDTPESIKTLPPWARKFVRRVDQKLEWLLDTHYSARDALAILNERRRRRCGTGTSAGT